MRLFSSARAALSALRVASPLGLALGALALTGCGHYYGAGGYPDRYPDGGYGVRRVAVLPGGGEVVRDGGRLLVIDRYGRRHDYGRGRAQVCHRGRTHSISDRALQGHLRHGDRLGGCRYDRYGYEGGYYDDGYGGYYDDGYYGGYYPGGYDGRGAAPARTEARPVYGGTPREATRGTGEVAPKTDAGRTRTESGRSGSTRSGSTGSGQASPRTRTESPRSEGSRTGQSPRGSSSGEAPSPRTESSRSGGSSSEGRSSSGGRGSTSRGGN